MKSILEAVNLGFSYGGEPVFSKVGFNLDKGDFAAIIGANGTGKSTLMRVLLGELYPLEGTIRLFGQDSRVFKDWTKIGYVPQNGIQANKDFPATAEEIVQANLYSQIGMFHFPKREHRLKTQKALALVDMGAYAKRMIGSMSGGQQQRVMLARVLVSTPELMILDEPTTGVDAATVASLYDLLARLNQKTGLTILMVTHDIARASEYVSRVFCLEDGSLVELAKSQIEDELSHKHVHPPLKGGFTHGHS